jgi:GTPase SAR1 family protein
LDYWYDAIRKATNEKIVIYLIGTVIELLGNKLDMVELNENYRKVEREKALELLMRYNLSFWGECSARENTNISDIFTAFYSSKH